jgi:hypothetical protein
MGTNPIKDPVRFRKPILCSIIFPYDSIESFKQTASFRKVWLIILIVSFLLNSVFIQYVEVFRQLDVFGALPKRILLYCPSH